MDMEVIHRLQQRSPGYQHCASIVQDGIHLDPDKGRAPQYHNQAVPRASGSTRLIALTPHHPLRRRLWGGLGTGARAVIIEASRYTIATYIHINTSSTFPCRTSMYILHTADGSIQIVVSRNSYKTDRSENDRSMVL
jgi:hypothetical protein